MKDQNFPTHAKVTASARVVAPCLLYKCGELRAVLSEHFTSSTSLMQRSGDNVMAERNYPCDSLILAYFGQLVASFFFTESFDL